MMGDPRRNTLCVFCGALTELSEPYCSRCGCRLPWADATRLDKLFARLGGWLRRKGWR